MSDSTDSNSRMLAEISMISACNRYLDFLDHLEKLRAVQKEAETAFLNACEKRVNMELELAQALRDKNDCAVVVGNHVLYAYSSVFGRGADTIRIHEIRGIGPREKKDK